MVGGLVAVGIAGYGFVALTGHRLSPAGAAAAAAFYLIATLAGPGVFTGLEQEVSRSTSAWLARGGAFRDVARRSAVVAVRLMLAVGAALAAVSVVLTDRVLSGSWGMFLAVELAVGSGAAIYFVRGLLGGRQQFTGYAVTLGAEGFARIAPCAVLAALATSDVVSYALVYALAWLVAAIVGLVWLRRADGRRTTSDAVGEEQRQTGPEPAEAGGTVAGMARAMGQLVVGMLGFQLVSNLSPIVVTAQLHSDKATAAAFASGCILVRVPVLMFAAVQAMLLPALTRAAARGDTRSVRQIMRRIVVLIGALGVPTVLASAVFGPWAVQFLFGSHVRLPRYAIGLPALSTVLLMSAQVLMPALIALGRHRALMLSWLVATGTLTGLLTIPHHLLLVASLAQLVACGVVIGMMTLALLRGMRAADVRSGSSVPRSRTASRSETDRSSEMM